MLILIMGLPGTGKTFFAETLATQIKALHISSDRIRIKMGLQNQYDESSRRRVYTEMRNQLKIALEASQTVILDASFYKKEIRDYFLAEAIQKSIPYFLVLITATDDTIKKRLQKPRLESEANYPVYLKMKQDFDPVSEPHLTLSSDTLTPEEMLKKLIAFIY
jgi:predicted kinase